MLFPGWLPLWHWCGCQWHVRPCASLYLFSQALCFTIPRKTPEIYSNWAVPVTWTNDSSQRGGKKGSFSLQPRAYLTTKEWRGESNAAFLWVNWQSWKRVTPIWKFGHLKKQGGCWVDNQQFLLCLDWILWITLGSWVPRSHGNRGTERAWTLLSAYLVLGLALCWEFFHYWIYVLLQPYEVVLHSHFMFEKIRFRRMKIWWSQF